MNIIQNAIRFLLGLMGLDLVAAVKAEAITLEAKADAAAAVDDSFVFAVPKAKVAVPVIPVVKPAAPTKTAATVAVNPLAAVKRAGKVVEAFSFDITRTATPWPGEKQGKSVGSNFGAFQFSEGRAWFEACPHAVGGDADWSFNGVGLGGNLRVKLGGSLTRQAWDAVVEATRVGFEAGNPQLVLWGVMAPADEQTDEFGGVQMVCYRLTVIKAEVVFPGDPRWVENCHASGFGADAHEAARAVPVLKLEAADAAVLGAYADVAARLVAGSATVAAQQTAKRQERRAAKTLRGAKGLEEGADAGMPKAAGMNHKEEDDAMA